MTFQSANNRVFNSEGEEVEFEERLETAEFQSANNRVFNSENATQAFGIHHDIQFQSANNRVFNSE